MEESVHSIEVLYEKVREYGDASYQLVKLNTIDKVADISSSVAVRLLVGLLLLVFYLMVNITLALWLGEITGKTYYGFLIIAGFNGLIGLLVNYLFKSRLKQRIANSIIRKLLK
jgi:hypothetical protein